MRIGQCLCGSECMQAKLYLCIFIYTEVWILSETEKLSFWFDPRLKNQMAEDFERLARCKMVMISVSDNLTTHKKENILTLTVYE